MFLAERGVITGRNKSRQFNVASAVTRPTGFVNQVRILIRVARGGDPDESRHRRGTATVVAPGNEGLKGAFRATAGGPVTAIRCRGAFPGRRLRSWLDDQITGFSRYRKS